MKNLPPTVKFYNKTKTFTEASVPAGLRSAHQTKADVWGRIVVLEGELFYRILEPEKEDILLSVGVFGIIEPQILHEVEPQGNVQFYVEFHRDNT